MQNIDLFKNKRIFNSDNVEYYNETSTNVRLGLNDKSSILVTTCGKNEGEIPVIINLAYYLTKLEKRVLIIDADFRRSLLYKIVKPSEENIGLANYLTGNVNMESILYNTGIKGFNILFSGIKTKNIIELLKIGRFEELINLFKKYYDYIFILSSPISDNIDSIVISEYCDSSMIVVKSNSIKRKVLIDSINRLKKVNNNFLGIILNDVDMSIMNYGSYGHYVNFEK
ncbi:polysaccharide biosynthesis tyrosine autokinase [Parvimonas sp. G1967]|uniref:polysaccharide biosynthesis tyrosine autokinase n=1 Tax=Parvimonas sp. G1967 TaxID=3387695 RepID=UPI0039E32698